jgi:uncharacterized protein (DUF488 family)
MREIFEEHLATAGAQSELEALAEIIRSGRRICLLCLEADPTQCHRSMVANALTSMVPMRVTHLTPAEL